MRLEDLKHSFLDLEIEDQYILLRKSREQRLIIKSHKEKKARAKKESKSLGSYTKEELERKIEAVKRLIEEKQCQMKKKLSQKEIG